MLNLLQYAKADGQIQGVWQADPATALSAQVQEGSETMAYALTETDLSPADILSGYVWQDGALAPKAAVTLVAHPTPFAADGVSECYVTVEPFMPCTLVIDGQPMSLTDADPIAVLTADQPHVFQIRLASSAQVRPGELLVEAT